MSSKHLAVTLLLAMTSMNVCIAGEFTDLPLPTSDGLLYSVDHNSGNLITIDPNTAEIDTVGATGFNLVEGLTYHAPTDTLLGVDNASDQLISVNRYTGAGVAEGAIGRDFVFGLTYSEAADALYGFDTQSNELLTINPGTADASTVTPTGYDFVGGLTDDPATGNLYGVDYGQDAIFSIVFHEELGPGISAPIVDVPSTAIQGLAFDTSTQDLFAVGIEVGTDQLLRINRFTDAVTVVGPLDGVALASLEFVPTIVPEPTTCGLLLVGIAVLGFARRSR